MFAEKYYSEFLLLNPGNDEMMITITRHSRLSRCLVEELCRARRLLAQMDLGDGRLYQVILGTIITILLAWREWSWRSNSQELKSSIEHLKKDVGSLSLYLQVEHLTPSIAQCERYTAGSVSGSSAASDLVNVTTTGDSYMDSFPLELQRAFGDKTKTITQRILYRPRASVFNLNGLGMVLLSSGAMLHEIYSIHKSTVTPTSSSAAGGNSASWSIGNKYFEAYVAQRKLLANAAAYAVVFALSSLAWMGVFTWSSFVPLLLKFTLCWTAANYVSYWTYNFLRLRQYLPKSWHEWGQSLGRGSWWLWVASRTFTSAGFMYSDVEKQDSGVLAACLSLCIRMLTDLVAFWPYRYFYYYGGGGGTASVDSSGNNSHNSSNSTSSTRTTDLFLLNMLIQLSIGMLLCCGSTSLAMGSPKWLKRRASACLGYCAPFLPIETVVSLSMLFLGCNAAVVLLRVVWFFFVGCGGCSWYGSLMLLLFPVQHVVLFFGYMATAAASLERSDIRGRDKEPFVQQFLSSHVALFRDHYDGLGLGAEVQGGMGHAAVAGGLESEPLLRDAAVLGCELFDALLDRTTRNYIVGYGDHTYATSVDSNATHKGKTGAERGGEEGVRESQYLQAFRVVCVDVFTAAQSMADEDEDDEDDADAGAGAGANVDGEGEVVGEEYTAEAGEELKDGPQSPTVDEVSKTHRKPRPDNDDSSTTSASATYSTPAGVGSKGDVEGSRTSTSSSSHQGRNSKLRGTDVGQDEVLPPAAEAQRTTPPPTATPGPANGTGVVGKKPTTSINTSDSSDPSGTHRTRDEPQVAAKSATSTSTAGAGTNTRAKRSLLPLEETRYVIESALGAIL